MDTTDYIYPYVSQSDQKWKKIVITAFLSALYRSFLNPVAIG